VYYYVLSLVLTPILIFFSRLTEGAILPSLTSHNTWTIEDTPMILSSIVGVYLASRGYSKTRKKSLMIIACAFNIALGLFHIYALITLWGEKF